MSEEIKTEKQVGVVALLARAVTDPEVRERLLSNPHELAQEFGLTEGDAEALKRISRADIEDASRQLEQRAWWGIYIFIKITF